jgi:hypothetical protein
LTTDFHVFSRLIIVHFFRFFLLETKKELTESEVENSAKSPDEKVRSFSLPFGTTPLPPELEKRKGRYWNYEKNRWSFCSDHSDDEQTDKRKKGDKEREKKTNEESIKKKTDEEGEKTNENWRGEMKDEPIMNISIADQIMKPEELQPVLLQTKEKR